MNRQQVVIAGAGIMGASLAQVYALGGYEVVLYDIYEESIAKGKRLIDINQDTLIKESIVTRQESERMRGKISFTMDKSCFQTPFLVVECIVENLDIKHAFWEEVSALAPDDAILATNTSGLHISKIAEKVRLPERFLGQHWLNPPHLLPLCELIQGEKTSPEVVSRMREIIVELGKNPVVVKDISGFIINRIQFAVLREALYIVESGAASFEDVDTVLKSGMGIRYSVLGPFGVADHGGLDTFHHINSYLNAELCDTKEPSKILKKLVDEGRLGVKSGKGIYDYSGDKAEQAIKERDEMYIALAKLLYFSKKEGNGDEK